VIQGLSVLALITARGGSKGLPGKNILPVSGRPLIDWTIAAAKGSRYVDRLILSSDDTQIIAVARLLGCEVPFVRDAKLASDTASSMNVVLDAVQRVPGYDLLLLLQPTSPLRTSTDIDAALELLVQTGAPCCVSVRPAIDHPYWSFGMTPEHRLERIVQLPDPLPTQRQALPTVWCLNGAVYVGRVPWLKSHKTFISAETVAVKMPADRSIDIDSSDDFDQFVRMLRTRDTERGTTEQGG
jgi:CMP-N,N'-diacetyllegionaminic acid synthase